jgi:threonine synthase
MYVICPDCGTKNVFDPHEYRCECGGAWEPVEGEDFDAKSIDPRKSTLWRYRTIFDLSEINEPFSLGAGWTPLVEADFAGGQTWFKLEFISPTGSFKDRGTEVEMNFLKASGIKDVVEDSSGNAGASMAAYAARAGLRAAIYAPDSASPAKLAQIGIFGAELHKIPGERIESTQAVLKAVEDGAVYASHAYNPAYLLGQQSVAWELWEQFDQNIPDALIIPTGQGGLLIGAWLGFRRLMRAGLIDRIPRLYSAQPDLLAPIHHAFSQGLDDIPEAKPTEKSIAEGLAIVKPVRSKRLLQALRESDGGAITVTEAEIMDAYHRLALCGIFAEPSSAVAGAAVTKVRAQLGTGARIVAALTGSGLKSPIKE